MKKESLFRRLMGLILIIAPITAWSQNTAITGSSFNMAFGVSADANTTVISAAGEVLVGSVEAGDTRVGSGFLVIIRQQAIVAIEEGGLLPVTFALHQNYPNPFNPSTTIQFDLPKATDIHIVVYNLLGREVARLVEQRLEAGYHQLVWNGRDRNGREVPTGMYIVLMTTPEYRKSIKLLLLK